jgi:hypothetical protein
MRHAIRWIPLAFLLVSLAAPSAADAQRRRGDGPSREQVEQRIRAQMGRMMQQRLGLDEEQASRLSEVVQTFVGQRLELAQREQATRQRVGELPELAAVEQEEALELLQLQAQLHLEEAQLFRAEQNALLEFLSPGQVMELQELRQDLGRRIRALSGDGRGGDARGSRGPGPRPDGRIGERRRRGYRPPVS